MTKVSCEIPERYVNPLFEVFDGGDFILSSYRDIERPLTEMRIYFEDADRTEAAKKALEDALEIVLGAAREGTRRTEDAACDDARRTEDAACDDARRTEDAACDDARRTDGGGRAASMRPPQLPEITVADVPEEDWKFAYRRHFKTERVSSRIFTVPEWEAADFFASGKLAPGQIAIVSDPGMAFGTGKHETTKACLMYIDELAGKGRPSTFLDMGTGSGILSIAAAKLGYSDVAGFDVDPEAVEAARENAAKNGVKIRFEHFALGRAADAGSCPRQTADGSDASSDADCSPRLRFSPADLVVANILGPLLIRFADEIVPYVKRTLVISGILTTLYPEVLSAYIARGFREISHKTIGEWTTGLLSRGRDALVAS